MKTYVALLRAVNVGGTGKMPMAVLKALCEAEGFASVKTFIASGNVVFTSDLSEAEVKARLEGAILARFGLATTVLVRSAAEMQAVYEANPFPQADPSRTVALFLDQAPNPDSLTQIRHQTSEELRLGLREIYIHYPDGMGQSKLVVPAARIGTARNINTIRKLAEMAVGL